MKMLTRKLTLACLIAAPVLVTGVAHAQFAKPQNAIDYRESAMTLMSNHFGRLAPYARGEKPMDAADVQANAALVATLAKLPWAAFGPGTEGGKAHEDVWKDSAKFKQSADRLQGDIVKLVAAAQTADAGQLRTAYGAVAASCKNCHDSFRKK